MKLQKQKKFRQILLIFPVLGKMTHMWKDKETKRSVCGLLDTSSGYYSPSSAFTMSTAFPTITSTQRVFFVEEILRRAPNWVCSRLRGLDAGCDASQRNLTPSGRVYPRLRRRHHKNHHRVKSNTLERNFRWYLLGESLMVGIASEDLCRKGDIPIIF